MGFLSDGGVLAFSEVFLFAAAFFSVGALLFAMVYFLCEALLGEASRLAARGNQCGAYNDKR